MEYSLCCTAKPPWKSGILNLSQENHFNKEVSMKNLYKNLAKGEEIFVGIDLHKKAWHVTVRSTDGELFNGSIPGSWDVLKHQLMKFEGHPIHAVYEAGYFGFTSTHYVQNRLRNTRSCISIRFEATLLSWPMAQLWCQEKKGTQPFWLNPLL
jgi:hypothetical protein